MTSFTDFEGAAALSATQAAAEMASGTLSAAAYAEALLARVAATEDTIRAFVHLDPAHVRAQARACDARRESGAPLGPLHGVPVGIKDVIDTADYPTEHGAALHAGRRPTRDAAVVAKLRAAGAVIFGKTVTTEVAFRHPGATRNPHDPAHTPGGSSSGSAAAVAAGMLPLALGTQTSGSVIRPASFCGVIGIKPTHGLVPRTGVMMHSAKLDHVGIFARHLGDAALVLDVIAGHDAGDPDSRPLAAANFAAAAAAASRAAPYVAFVRTPMWGKADAEAREALEALAGRLGSRAVAVDLPDWFAPGWAAQHTIMAADMVGVHGAAVDAHPELASAPLRERLAEGRTIRAVDYLAAHDLARRMTAALTEMFAGYDAILTLAAPGAAPKGLQSTGDAVFNALWSLTGLPALTLPLLRGRGGLPIGVQLLGVPGADARLLRAAAALPQALAA